MKVRFGKEPQTLEREVTGSFGSFFITVRAPTAIERARIRHFIMREEYDRLAELRRSLVVGWRDVTDEEEKPIPFNGRNLDIVCGANSDIESGIMATVGRFTDENLTLVAGDEGKN